MLRISAINTSLLERKMPLKKGNAAKLGKLAAGREMSHVLNRITVIRHR
ncbi:hypothetical protein L4D08_09400 [Photobacterium chitinilyticum]